MLKADLAGLFLFLLGCIIPCTLLLGLGRRIIPLPRHASNAAVRSTERRNVPRRCWHLGGNIRTSLCCFDLGAAPSSHSLCCFDFARSFGASSHSLCCFDFARPFGASSHSLCCFDLRLAGASSHSLCCFDLRPPLAAGALSSHSLCCLVFPSLPMMSEERLSSHQSLVALSFGIVLMFPSKITSAGKVDYSLALRMWWCGVIIVRNGTYRSVGMAADFTPIRSQLLRTYYPVPTTTDALISPLSLTLSLSLSFSLISFPTRHRDNQCDPVPTRPPDSFGYTALAKVYPADREARSCSSSGGRPGGR